MTMQSPWFRQRPVWMTASGKRVLANLILLPAAFAVIAALLAAYDPVVTAITPGESLIANVLPLFILFALLWALTGRPAVAIWLIHLVLFVVYTASEQKMKHLGVPLISTDFLLAQNVFDSSHVLLRYVDLAHHRIQELVLLGVAGIVVLRFDRNALTWSARASLLASAIFLSVSLATPSPLQRWYRESSVRLVPWEPTKNVRSSGLIATLAKGAFTAHPKFPDHDEAMASKAAARVDLPHHPPLPAQLPDMLVWMSESFFDPGTLTEWEECQDTAQLCALRQRGISGDLTVPAFAGATIRTEFSFLTGLSLTDFPDHAYPYLSLINRPLASMVRDLKRRGYHTVAVHSNHRTFWNRHVAMPLLGFDRFVALDDLKPLPAVGYYPSDLALTERVLKLLEEIPSPKFIFAISMENHGPWGRRANLVESEVIAKSAPTALTPAAKRQWQEYVYHLEHADTGLGQLWAAVAGRPYPTALLFFGDHLPGLPLVYRELAPDRYAQPQQIPTPYVLLHNQDRFTVRQENLDVANLFAFVLQQLDLCTSEFCQQLEWLRVHGAGAAKDATQLRAWTRALRLRHYYAPIAN